MDPGGVFQRTVAALKSAGAAFVHVFAVGESWKIRDLQPTDLAACKVFRATGLPGFVTEQGEQVGPKSVGDCLHSEQRAWSMSFRSSLARIEARDQGGGVIIRLDLGSQPLPSAIEPLRSEG